MRRIVVLCLSLMLLLPQAHAAEGELPVLGSITDFELLDSDKQPFDSSKLKGKVWLASFFFTNCPGVCPLINGKVAALHSRIKDNDKLRIVSITVDPMRDGPTALREYAAKYKADTSRWHFLTGSNVDVEEVLEKRFHLTGEEASIAHTDRILLVDGEMKVRGRYAATESEAIAALERDMQRLAEEG